MTIREKLGKELIFFDGGTGTILQEQGLKAGELPEVWNIEHRDKIVTLHKNYLTAGADILKTNTFGANRLKFPEGGAYCLKEIVTVAIDNAKKAVEEIGGKQRYIALDIGPTGKLLKPMGDLDFEDACTIFKEVIQIGVACGVDLILIETMSDSYEAKAAVLAAKESCDLPVFVTTIYGENGKLLTGGNTESTVALLEGLGVDALGINCGLGPVQMKGICEQLLKYASIPVIVNPNAGLPRSENGKTVFDVTPKQFTDTMEEIANMGAWLLGGCCGTTPSHIRALVDRCHTISPLPIEKKDRTVVSSYSQAVVIGKKPVIIGERINPTGKSKFKQALRDHNLEYILNEGLTQQEKGAHILDVNVGLPEIDEVAMMEEVVKELQSILDLPLQIDTSNFEAMERAMRIYNGKPMINSVNGKKEVMDAVFPLVKKYGGVVVGLALDENGIPDTVEGRVAVAEKIYQTAQSYGIEKKDIVIDALAMTISSDSSSALVTLETLRRIRDDYNGKTILGISNISFGLPQREIVNSNFYTMAMQNGLSCGIINPNSDAMMRSYYAFKALSNLDAQCSDYIAHYANQASVSAPVSAKTDMILAQSIEKGLKERAGELTAQLIQNKEALDIINEELIPALDRVGKGFEKGTVFLPQLLMSAEAAKTAFEVIKKQFAKSGQVQEKKGKIILATVKGDIHDIGKNIVKVLLENYSYDVIDLGKDVPAEVIVETALKEKVRLVGLSALMTTTVVNMKETIQLIRKRKPDTKVVVGGAVLTPEYAKSIGADCYAKDAMATVHYAQEILV
ncbi:MAG: homocysteine S-methyltransferase family protein [Clostridiales bacterium]|nr:homocysteine S-methyltransferase family protein [Clostridiales bacterium]